MVTLSKAPKATTRKSGGSKKVSKTSKRVLAKAQGEQCFWANDGKILATLVDLERALLKMSKDTFLHHVRGTKNDFADWVEFVLGDTELALELRGATTAAKTRTLVARRLKIYDLK